MGRPATGQTPVRSVRIPDTLWDTLKRLAAGNGRTTSEEVVAALDRHVALAERRRGSRP